MRNIVLIFTFLFLLSCKKSESKTELEIKQVNDINQIVQVVIIEDSLKVLKNGTDTRMFCKELTKLSVYVPEKTKDGISPPPPPPSFNQVSIEDLLHYRKSFYFSAKDSLSLLKQNSNPEKFKIEESLAEKINQTQVALNAATKILTVTTDTQQNNHAIYTVTYIHTSRGLLWK